MRFCDQHNPEFLQRAEYVSGLYPTEHQVWPTMRWMLHSL